MAELKDSPSRPHWLNEMAAEGKTLRFTTDGHAWLKFHNWAFQRFPPHDVSAIGQSERREIFLGARAVMISHHHVAGTDDHPNAFLYLCDDKNYSIDSLSANNRSKVRRGLKRFDVRRAHPSEIGALGYDAYFDTCTRNGLQPISADAFARKWDGAGERSARELWAAFSDDKIAAVGTVWRCGKWAELMSTQSADAYLSDYVNHALFFRIIEDLMHRDEIESVSYGLSSVQPGSKIESLHHFKLSVGLQAVPVVRKIEVNPFLKPVVNRLSHRLLTGMEKLAPKSRHLLSARGAFELMVGKSTSTVTRLSDGVHPINAAELRALANLHIAVFPEYLSFRLGVRYCEEMFARYRSDQDGFGFCVVKEGRIVGYVLGGRKGIHKRVTSSLKTFAIRELLTKPSLWIGQIRERINLRGAARSETTQKPGAGELREIGEPQKAADLVLIGVSEKARGTGAAQALMSAYLEKAKTDGFALVKLVVRRDNARARAAYEKGGWSLVDRSGDGVGYTFTFEAHG